MVIVATVAAIWWRRRSWGRPVDWHRAAYCEAWRLVSDARVLASADAADGRRASPQLCGRTGIEGARDPVLPLGAHGGMRFRSIAFVAADGTVTKIARMPPWRIGAGARGAG